MKIDKDYFAHYIISLWFVLILALIDKYVFGNSTSFLVWGVIANLLAILSAIDTE